MAARKALKKEIKQLEKQLKLLKKEYKVVKEKEKSTKKLTKLSERRLFNDSQSDLNEQKIVALQKQIPHSLKMSTPIAFRPFKNPPCKRCPALTSGICKCALKRLKVANQ